jgi:hypothetical protein
MLPGAVSFMRTPPKTNHFTWVRDEPIIPIKGIGPDR